MAQTCNPSTQETETRDIELKVHSLEDIERTYLKTQRRSTLAHTNTYTHAQRLERNLKDLESSLSIPLINNQIIFILHMHRRRHNEALTH